MRIKELKSWLKREAADSLQPANEEAKKLVDKLRERLNDAREVCVKLENEGNKQLEKGKAVRKAKVTLKLSRYFLKQIDKIRFPDVMSFSGLDELHRDLEKTFSSIARERNMWFHRISPLFIIARKRVDFAFGRLAGSISDLKTFLADEYSNAETVERLQAEIDEATRLLRELTRCNRSVEGIKAKLSSLKRDEEESRQSLESFAKSTALKDLASTRLEVLELRKQVKHSLRHLVKPLRKLANLRKGDGYALSSEETEKLHQYLVDPFTALAKEKPGYPTLKSILVKTHQAMNSDRLKLKGSRLRKGQESIDSILGEDSLEALQEESARALSLREQLSSSEETQNAHSRSEETQRKLNNLRKQKQAASVRLETLEREQRGLADKVEKQKEALERMVLEAFEKRITIKLMQDA